MAENQPLTSLSTTHLSSLKRLNIEMRTEPTDWNLGRGFQTVKTCDGIKSVIVIPLLSTY